MQLLREFVRLFVRVMALMVAVDTLLRFFVRRIRAY